jgi:hypothetical protein
MNAGYTSDARLDLLFSERHLYTKSDGQASSTDSFFYKRSSLPITVHTIDFKIDSNGLLAAIMHAIRFTFLFLGASLTFAVLGYPLQDSNTSNVPLTGNPNECPAGTHFIRQPVYHTEQAGGHLNDTTFLQQYEIITDYFKPGGPIFFWQGDEGSIQCVEELQMYEWAEEFGALLLTIEHRYFGISMPFGLKWEDNEQWPTHVLKPLTLSNVQLDSVRLIEHVKEAVPGANDSKVVAFGGSYSAVLATLHRVRYPDVFYGAIATSAPTHYVSDPASSDAYLWGDWVCCCLSHR